MSVTNEVWNGNELILAYLECNGALDDGYFNQEVHDLYDKGHSFISNSVYFSISKLSPLSVLSLYVMSNNPYLFNIHIS